MTWLEIKTYDWMPANFIAICPVFISCPADLLCAIEEGTAQLIKIEQNQDVVAHSVRVEPKGGNTDGA